MKRKLTSAAFILALTASQQHVVNCMEHQKVEKKEINSQGAFFTNDQKQQKDSFCKRNAPYIAFGVTVTATTLVVLMRYVSTLIEKEADKDIPTYLGRLLDPYLGA